MVEPTAPTLEQRRFERLRTHIREILTGVRDLYTQTAALGNADMTNNMRGLWIWQYTYWKLAWTETYGYDVVHLSDLAPPPGPYGSEQNPHVLEDSTGNANKHA